MRALAAALGLVLVAAIALDVGATAVIERRVSERVRAELGSGPVDVDLRGWPVAVRLLAGRIPEVGVEAADVPLQARRAVLRRLSAELRDVRVGVDGAGLGAAVAGSGTFSAELSEDQLAALFDAPLDVTLGEGVIRLSSAALGIDAAATVLDGIVVVRPASPDLENLFSLSLPLEDLPDGATVTGVEVGRGILLIEGTVTDLPLTRDR